jgi:hypothetical protein
MQVLISWLPNICELSYEMVGLCKRVEKHPSFGGHPQDQNSYMALTTQFPFSVDTFLFY